MKLRTSITAIALVTLACCTGCSLVKLSDDIAQEHCKTDADCDVLNSRGASDFDPCELWQCSDTKYCEFTPLDQDKDGFTPHTVSLEGEDLVCEAKADKQDCDDDSSARKPGGKETCDDIDNDCDLLIDEGVLQPHVAEALGFTGDNSGGAGQFSYATDPTSGALAIAYSINRAPAVVGFRVLDNDLPAGGSAGAVKLAGNSDAALLADSVGVGALGAGKFAIAFFNLDGAQHRVVAGTMDANTGTLRVVESVRTGGLHCTEDEQDKCTDTTTDPTRTPALAALGDDVLVSYVRAAAEPGAVCKDKSDAVAAHPILANLLSTTVGGLQERTAHAVVIGETTSLDAPTILTIPDLAAGKTFGWLIGYVDDAGAVVWKSVRAQGAELVVSGVLARLENDGQRYSGVRAALGPKTEAGQVVGASFQAGCTASARIGVALLVANVGEGDAPTLQVQVAERLVGGAPNEKDAALAFSPERGSWAVVYRDPTGLRGRVLDAAGNPVGDEAYVLIEEVDAGPNMTKVFLAPAVVPTLAAGGWFGAVAYTERAGQDPLTLSSVTLSGCAKP